MDLNQILILVGVVVLLGGFMFYSSYRNKKRNAEIAEMTNSLVVGDKIQTAGGIIGEITEVDKEKNTITVSTGTSTIVFNKQVVYPVDFFDKHKPVTEQKNQTEESSEITEGSVDTMNADFLDTPGGDMDKPSKSKKSKQNKAKFE